MPNRIYKTISPQITAITFGILAVAFLTIFYVVAWQEPSQAPPAGNVAAPINIGPTGQSKEGGLILNTGGAENGLIIDKGNTVLGGNVDIKGIPSFGGKNFTGWAQVSGPNQSVCNVGGSACSGILQPNCGSLTCAGVCESAGCSCTGTYKNNPCVSGGNCAYSIGDCNTQLCRSSGPSHCATAYWEQINCGVIVYAGSQCLCSCPSGTTYQVPTFK